MKLPKVKLSPAVVTSLVSLLLAVLGVHGAPADASATQQEKGV